MSSGIDVLHAEHQAILRAVDLLEAGLDAPRNGKSFQKQDWQERFEFFRVFVQTCHHGKEEALVFPRFVSNWGERERMLDDHHAGEALIRDLETLSENGRSGTTEFAAKVRAFAAGLRAHIDREESGWMTDVRRQWSADEQQDLAARMDVFETEVMGPGVHEEFHRRFERWLAQA